MNSWSRSGALDTEGCAPLIAALTAAPTAAELGDEDEIRALFREHAPPAPVILVPRRRRREVDRRPARVPLVLNLLAAAVLVVGLALAALHPPALRGDATDRSEPAGASSSPTAPEPTGAPRTPTAPGAGPWSPSARTTTTPDQSCPPPSARPSYPPTDPSQPFPGPSGAQPLVGGPEGGGGESGCGPPPDRPDSGSGSGAGGPTGPPPSARPEPPPWASGRPGPPPRSASRGAGRTPPPTSGS